MSKASRKAAKKEELSTIFGETALTMQEREAREKQARAEEKQRLREQRRMRREAAKATKSPKDVRQATILVVVLIAFVVLGAVMLILSNGSFGRQAKPGMTYFIDEASFAQKSDDGISAVITQAYYTNNGGLYMHLSLANGMEVSQHPTRIHVKLANGEGETIVEAAVSNIDKDFYVIYDGYGSYELFIPKSHVQIKDDSLATISYEITIDSEDYV